MLGQSEDKAPGSALELSLDVMLDRDVDWL